MNQDGGLNIAPMGPICPDTQSPHITQLIFRPFAGSLTGENLLRDRCGVFHLTDDSLVLASAVTKNWEYISLQTTPARIISGLCLQQVCSRYEFRIIDVQRESPRTTLTAEIVNSETIRPWRGYNRAQFAVLELAILATRCHLLASSDILNQQTQLEQLIQKTAGPREKQAFELLAASISEQLSALSKSPGNDHHG